MRALAGLYTVCAVKKKKEMSELAEMQTVKTSSSVRSALNVPDVMRLLAGSCRSNGLSRSLWAVYKQPTQPEWKREGDVMRRNEGESVAMRESVREGAAMKKDGNIGLETGNGN